MGIYRNILPAPKAETVAANCPPSKLAKNDDNSQTAINTDANLGGDIFDTVAIPTGDKLNSPNV